MRTKFNAQDSPAYTINYHYFKNILLALRGCE